MTQANLSRAAGVNQRQLARYEQDVNEPLLGTAARIADALEISLDQLAERGPADAALDAALDRIKDIPFEPRENAWR